MSIASRDLRVGDRHDELVAVVALLRIQALSPERLAAILDHLGSAVEVVRSLLAGNSLPEAAQLTIVALTEESVADAVNVVAQWERQHLQVRTVLDRDYPGNLQAVFNKPPILFIEGRWDDLQDSRAVAVVGTRAATKTGIARAARLSSGLVKAGFTVVSGLARGIDTAAHIAALKEGGRTVSVMGTGILRRYPRSNEALAQGILAGGGALLSQFIPDQPPTKWTFPKRNVVMSGLSLATVVVEASATSGAKMQAEAALTHGRAVFLPSSLVSERPWAHQMVTEGFRGVKATAVGSTDELVQHLDFSLPLPPVTV